MLGMWHSSNTRHSFMLLWLMKSKRFPLLNFFYFLNNSWILLCQKWKGLIVWLYILKYMSYQGFMRLNVNYELVLQQTTFYLSKLGLFGFISPKTVNYLAFDFEHTWWWSRNMLCTLSLIYMFLFDITRFNIMEVGDLYCQFIILYTNSFHDW
jgi:hypothetical protein